MKTTRRGTWLWLTGLLVGAAGCREVGLPSSPSSGTVQATVLYAEPGRTTPQPAIGATVELLRSSVKATVTEATGFVLISPITTDTGALLFRFDADKDGVPEFQRVIRLEEIGARPGRDIVLGNVVLGGTATVRGSVLGRDRAGQTQGHGGTTVFVPEGPYLGYSGDNGGFSLEGLPEGRLTLTFFREGYASANVQVTLQANQRFELTTVLLERSTPAPAAVTVSGTVRLFGTTDSSGVTIRTNGVATNATSDAAGRYVFAMVPPGLHTFGFEKEGFQSAVLRNVLVENTPVELPAITLVPGPTTTPELDAGVPPYDAGLSDAGLSDAGLSDAGPSDAGLSDAGLSDAGPSDAGPPDAGPPDAGPPDAGPPDAGPPDAGPPDAGPLDAGPPDAGPLDAGPPDAGPLDAGPRPVAVVDPTLPFYATNTVVTLVGQNSLGQRPLTYRWSQDGGATFTTANNSQTAATIGVRLPATAGVTRLALTVVDARGAVSDPTEFSLVGLSGAPVAAISPVPPATAYGDQRFTVGSTGSNDPSNTGLTAYEWTIVPSNVGIVGTPLDGGTRFELVMPSTPTVNTPVSVQLVVTNGFGVRSPPATTTFTLSTQSAPTWTLDAGPLRIVPGGSTVTLVGLATPPAPGPTFSYAWSPLGVTDAGLPQLNWQLTTPDAATTQFIAPAISGLPQVITFTLTATNTNGGLTPAQRSTQLLVRVVDQRPPQVLGTSIVGMRGSPFGAYVDYDEDLLVPFTSPPTVSGYSEPAKLYGARRLRVAFNRLVQDGDPLTLGSGQPEDWGGNRVTFVTFPYLAQYLWPSAAAAQPSASSQPLPTVVLSPFGTLGEASATLLSRRDGAAVIHAALPLPSCLPSGCAIVPDTAAPTVALSPTGTRAGPSVVEAGGKTYVLLQVADSVGNAGVAVVRTPTSWAPIASPPGTLFSDGTTLYSAYVQTGSLAFASYDAANDSWSAPTVVETNATDYASGPTSQARVWGRMSSLGVTWIIARTAQGNLRTLQRLTPTSPWTNTVLGSPSASGNAFADVKIVFESPGDNGNYVMLRRGNGDVTINFMSTGGSGGNTTLTNVSSFDAMLGSADVWAATIESGHLTLRYSRSLWTPLLAQPRGGPPTSLNNDVNCTADAPVLQRRDEHMVLAWQERCGGGPWVAYLRWLR